MRLAAILPALALAACATAAPAPVSEAEPALSGELADPFSLAIETERYDILIRLAIEGAFEGPPAMTAPEDDGYARAAAALHGAAHNLYALRADVCSKHLVGPDGCGPLPPPGWLGEPVDAEVDAAEIRRRIDWLTSVMWPFVDAGCDAGRSRQRPGEPDYCSVE